MQETQLKAGFIEKFISSSPNPLSHVLTTNPGVMLSGNGISDYEVEAHTLGAHKATAAPQEYTTTLLGIYIEMYHMISEQINS